MELMLVKARARILLPINLKSDFRYSYVLRGVGEVIFSRLRGTEWKKIYRVRERKRRKKMIKIAIASNTNRITIKVGRE